ncbi:Sulfatase [Rubripirellula tenax]|uniref:Sulfatase n=1 Tax=Rubripirellula tenax TaxID=2528015 RepID=A0A5C6FKJ1_9BACT|nr:sulfatase-like hydrolase/transferase [Rubripirellula tenax]TWU60527.1 Sulfatase [Rubripirellula tenax]
MLLRCLFAAFAIGLFRFVDPLDLFGDSVANPVVDVIGWLAVLFSFGAVADIGPERWRRLLRAVASIACLILPCVFVFDAVLFRWMGDHIWSWSVWRVVTDLREGLLQYASWNVAQGVAIPTALSAVYVIAATAAMRFQRPRSLAWKPWLAIVAAGWFAAILFTPKFEKAVVVATKMPPVTSDWDFRSAIANREQDYRLLVGQRDVIAPPNDRDVLIVVVESFRHELITAEGTPNLWRLAQEGIWCRQHYSGGNATNHGMFSLVSGLEAVWYDHPIRYSPAMNRLFRSAGYELGFFAGHDDWRTFRMDGYISDEQFDRFEIEPHDGLASDRRATMGAARFLDRKSEETRPPRLAMLYLYATHATYDSYPDDRRFTPAADDRFTIPFKPDDVPRVWNRYRNAAMTADRMIGALVGTSVGDDRSMQKRIVMVTGDHGESFLEDGTIGHGTKLSPQQNMTPAIIWGSDVKARVIDTPTMHADLLPTLLTSVGINISQPTALDGVDLVDASDDDLRSRVFVTRDYMTHDVAIVGSEGSMQRGATVSIKSGQIHDDGGLLGQWLANRFGSP